MATALFGKVEEFDERLGHFFDANGITEADKKRAIFLSVVGPVTYRLLKSLVAPDKPGSKSYDDLVKQLTEHYDPTPSDAGVQQFKSHSRNKFFYFHLSSKVPTHWRSELLPTRKC